MAAAGLRPAASTMLPSVWTTISVAFWVLRPSPSCRVVLPLCGEHTHTFRVTSHDNRLGLLNVHVIYQHVFRQTL